MISLCPHTIMYIIFSITHIIMDAFNGLYNTALMKSIVMIMISLLLNILCNNGLIIVAWIIVFIPFIMMTLIISMLLYIFGLNASTGTLNTFCKNPQQSDNKLYKLDNLGNIMIYDPYYNSQTHPVYYNNPYIIIPKPRVVSNNSPTYNVHNSSDPAYKS